MSSYDIEMYFDRSFVFAGIRLESRFYSAKEVETRVNSFTIRKAKDFEIRRTHIRLDVKEVIMAIKGA